MNVIANTDNVLLVQGDALDVLRKLGDCTVDALVCDPPAGIGFMGKQWDSDKGGRVSWIEWLTEIMQEARRVMKPGAHGLVWALPRTSHWTGTALEDASFEVRDRVSHFFGTGFPKSLNVSKAIDKQRHNRDEVLHVTAWITAARDRAGLTNKDIDDAFGFSGMAGHWTSQKSQPAVPTLDQIPRLLKVLKVQPPPEIERLILDLNGKKGQPGEAWFRREVVGHSDNGIAGGSGQLAGIDGAWGFSGEYSITSPAKPESKQWDGWGTALKPACEDWWLIRKPLDGTVAANVLEHGTGALNIDACRIGERDRTNYGLSNAQRTQGGVYGAPTPDANFDASKGRWPANVVFDSEAAAHLDAQAPMTKSTKGKPRKSKGPGDGYGMTHTGAEYSDAGGPSRFFYVAKPARKERDAGLDHLAPSTGGEATGRKDGSAGTKNPRAGAGRTGGARNTHPCLPPGEVVRTIDGWRPIESVRVHDLVLAHDGLWRRVVDAFATQCDGGVTTVDVEGENRTSTLTDNHPLLIWRPQKKRNSIVDAGVLWMPAGDVRVGDYSMTPLVVCGERVDYNVDWWWALGLWLAEGSVLSGGKSPGAEYPVYTLSGKEGRFVTRLRKLFGDDRVRVYSRHEGRAMNVVVFVRGLLKRWRDWCGTGALSKRLPSQAWKQDEGRRRALLEGYLDGDGCIIRDMPRAKSASEDLAAGIATLAETCGYHSTTYRYDSKTGTKEIQGRTVVDRGHVAIYLGNTARVRRPRTVEYEGVTYTLRRVKAVARRRYKGVVHNLTIEEAHTFQVRVGMSHNTVKAKALMSWLIRLITPPGGTVLDPFTGSGSTGIAAVEGGWKFVGIERDEKYAEIARARIEHAAKESK